MTWGVVESLRAAGRRLAAGGEWWLAWSGRNLPLTFKLAVPVIVTTIALVAVMGGRVSGAVQEQIERAYDGQAAAIANGAEAMYAEHPSDVSQIDVYLASLAQSDPDVESVRILSADSQGTVIASGDPREIGQGGFADALEMRAILGGYAMQDENDGPVLTTVYPLRRGATIQGAVFLVTSKARQEAAIRSTVIAIAASGSTAVVIESLFLLSAIYVGILRRTRRVQRVVEAVGRGDTTVRLPDAEGDPGRDEIFNLAHSVGRMIKGVDERQRGDALIRRLGQRALEGITTENLIGESLVATREALGLETCMFATIAEDGSMAGWRDGSSPAQDARMLPVWIFALTRVAVEARKAVLTDRLGQHSRFVDGLSVTRGMDAVIVPLPRTSKAGHAILAIAPAGETVRESGLAVLDAVAATIAESLHMHAAEAARTESAVKSRVMSAVSHEMRNPLNSIIGFTGLVLGGQNENLTTKQRRQLGFVQTSAANMLTLVNNYLDLAKVRSGDVPLQYERIRLADAVSEVVNQMQPTAAGRRVTIRTSVAPEAEARLDRTRVRQILTNLVSNAVKFTSEGGRVYVRGRVDANLCRLAVSDTGVGISKEDARLVFNEFSKVDAGPLAASKGTGLGLALTRAFVGSMGGTISFHSRRGRGTTLVVRLPREPESAKPVQAA